MTAPPRCQHFTLCASKFPLNIERVGTFEQRICYCCRRWLEFRHYWAFEGRSRPEGLAWGDWCWSREIHQSGWERKSVRKTCFLGANRVWAEGNLSTEGWGCGASGLLKNSSVCFPRLEVGLLWIILPGLCTFAYLLRVREKNQIIHLLLFSQSESQYLEQYSGNIYWKQWCKDWKLLESIIFSFKTIHYHSLISLQRTF